MDGRDSVGAGGTPRGGGHGEGLRVCTDVPHVTTHLTANDPVRMREFAQSLSAELKRRAELLGRVGFVEWHSRHEVSGRIIAQRGTSGAGDLDSPSSSTIRLRPSAAARQQMEAAPPLPRLVVVVDDLDALVKPPLGSPGRLSRRFGDTRAGGGGPRGRAARRAPGGGGRRGGPYGRDGARPAHHAAGRPRRGHTGSGRTSAGAWAVGPGGRPEHALPGWPGDGTHPAHGDAPPDGGASGVAAHGRPRPAARSAN